MSNEEPTVEQPAEEDGGWLDEPEELPRRPRRRLLAPLPIALLIVLLSACGFIGGVLVEKGQGSSGSASGTGASALASRFAALRGGSAAGAKSGASGSGASGAGSLFGGSGGPSGGAGAGADAGATTGQVAYIQGSTLYVTTAEGNTVKVDTSPASTVTKTVKAGVNSIRPGETVLVIGATGRNGAVSAEAIRVGTGGGGLAGLFGRGGARSSTGRSNGAGSSGGGGGEPALFGKGG